MFNPISGGLFELLKGGGGGAFWPRQKQIDVKANIVNIKSYKVDIINTMTQIDKNN